MAGNPLVNLAALGLGGLTGSGGGGSMNASSNNFIKFQTTAFLLMVCFSIFHFPVLRSTDGSLSSNGKQSTTFRRNSNKCAPTVARDGGS